MLIGRRRVGRAAVRSERVAVLALLHGLTIAGLAGCAAQPRSTAALQRLDQEMEHLEQHRLEEMASCDGDPACEAEVRERYLSLRARVLELRLDVIEEEWERTRAAR